MQTNLKFIIFLLLFLLSNFAFSENYYYVNFKNEKGHNLGNGYLKYFPLKSKKGYGAKFFFKLDHPVLREGSIVGYIKVDNDWNLISFVRDDYSKGKKIVSATGNLEKDLFICKLNGRISAKLKTPITHQLFLPYKYNSSAAKNLNFFVESTIATENVSLASVNNIKDMTLVTYKSSTVTHTFEFSSKGALVITKNTGTLLDKTQFISELSIYNEKIHPKNQMHSFFMIQD